MVLGYFDLFHDEWTRKMHKKKNGRTRQRHGDMTASDCVIHGRALPQPAQACFDTVSVVSFKKRGVG